MLPDQTILKYSKMQMAFEFILATGLAYGAFMLSEVAHDIVAYLVVGLVSAIAILFFWVSLSEMIVAGKSQLILTAEGITISGQDFYDWNIITNERVERTGQHIYMLIFTVEAYYPYNVRTDISKLTKTPDAIANLVRQYRDVNTEKNLLSKRTNR
jgi:hypothetical protein